jgi:hypothetical protein
VQAAATVVLHKTNAAIKGCQARLEWKQFIHASYHVACKVVQQTAGEQNTAMIVGNLNFRRPHFLT